MDRDGHSSSDHDKNKGTGVVFFFRPLIPSSKILASGEEGGDGIQIGNGGDGEKGSRGYGRWKARGDLAYFFWPLISSSEEGGNSVRGRQR